MTNIKSFFMNTSMTKKKYAKRKIMLNKKYAIWQKNKLNN